MGLPGSTSSRYRSRAPSPPGAPGFAERGLTDDVETGRRCWLAAKRVGERTMSEPGSELRVWILLAESLLQRLRVGRSPASRPQVYQ